MKIGVISDTHDNLNTIKKAVEVFNNEKVGLVVHGGDLISPFTAAPFKKLNCKMVVVFGNNDGERIGLKARYSEIGNINEGPYSFEFGGRKMLVAHYPNAVDALAASGRYDLIVYGHTHQLDAKPGKTLVLNPGDGGGWVAGKATAAIVELDDMSYRIVDL